MWKKIEVEEAVGVKLAHDVTRVVPGQFKGPAFRRGHVIKREDIQKLLDIGERHVYILKLKRGELHEDDVARRLALAIIGPGISSMGPREGRTQFRAKRGAF